VPEPDGADCAVINTCGFVESAQRESLDTIEEVLSLKARGRLAGVIVVGCLVQRFRQALKKELPEVDAFLPITDYSGIPAVLHALGSGRNRRILRGKGGGKRTSDTDLGRLLLTFPHVSYLRIAEGCNHRCSFCAIPAIRGRLRSKPMGVLEKEAERLAASGVKEINLVAEDTTDYGRDLEGASLLPDLLGRLGRIRGLRWIRLLYAYPSRITHGLMEEIAGNPRVLKYIDMPIQHISGRILTSMRRGTSPRKIGQTIAALRQRIPGIVLRTSVIVGYPGETDTVFQELYDFLKAIRFERLGAFLFSAEEGTAAACLEDRVPPEEAQERLDRIMTLQKRIILSRNKSLVGNEEEVIVDVVRRDGEAIGRTHADAPEIDCAVRLEPGQKLKPGMLVRARIIGFSGYDLLAIPGTEISGPRE
jgi:ribosomal protein S12 methylthiotransferase